MSSYEDPLLEKEGDLTFGVYEDEDGLKTWWKAPIEQTYNQKKHNHDGEIVTRGTYALGPRRKDVFINDGPSSTGIRAIHGGEIGTKEAVHIHVHGFNTDQEKASSEFSQVTQNFTHSQTEHIGYNWDSFQASTEPPSRAMVLDEEWQQKVYGETKDAVGWKKHSTSNGSLWKWVKRSGVFLPTLFQSTLDTWYGCVLIARLNGKRLATFIIDLLTGSPRGEEPNIFLSGYSLGAQVVLAAVRHLAKYYDDPAFTSNGGILSGVYLIGPAVPSNAVSMNRSNSWEEESPYADIYQKKDTYRNHPYGEELSRIVKDKPDGNIHVAIGSSDTTLSNVYRVAMDEESLGYQGPYDTIFDGVAELTMTKKLPLPSTLWYKNYSTDLESWTTYATYRDDFHGLWLDHRTVWKDVEKNMKEANDLYGPDPDNLAASVSTRRIDLEDSSSQDDRGLEFSAEGSTAREREITDYTWKFGGDHGLNTQSGESVHVPRSSIDDTGVYEVTLTVTDDAGNTDSVVSSYRVSPQFLHGDRLEAVLDVGPYPDQELTDELYPSPEADPHLDPDLIESESETEVTLDSEEFDEIIGGISFDPTRTTEGPDPITSFDWEFEGIDPSTSLDDDGILRVPMSEFSSPGEYDVTLTVTDESGGSDSTTETYTVESEWLENATPDSKEISSNVGVASFRQDDGASWQQVSFDSWLSNPVVVLGPAQYRGSNPTTLRGRNVSQSGFELQIDEWDYLDDWHTEEEVPWMALEAGTYDTPDITMEAGTVSTDDNWTRVSFSTPFSWPPIVVSSCMTYNGPDAVTTRQRNVSSDGFDVRLQESEAKGGHTTETVHYIAIEPTYSGAIRAATATGSDNWNTVHYGDFSSPPVFLASMQTFNGDNPAALRHRNRTTTSTDVLVEEEQSRDSETAHVDEDVGWLAVPTDW